MTVLAHGGSQPVRVVPDWIAFRHSLANVWRREQAGETEIRVCEWCECELDVAAPAHSPKCGAA